MMNEYDMYRFYETYYPYMYPYQPYVDNHYSDGVYYPAPYMNSYPYYYFQQQAQMPPFVANVPQTNNETQAANRMLQQFLDENGQVDIQKMLQTVGQLADTVQQVSPVIRQVNDLIRQFRA